MSTEITLHDGTNLNVHDGPEIRTIINRLAAGTVSKHYIVRGRGDEGVGTLGLFVEVLIGTHRQTRYFVYGENVYASTRTIGEAKFGRWRKRSAKSPEHALNIISEVIAKDTTQVFGHPVLVEMKADDISAHEAGQIPGARFRGQYRIERQFGRLELDGTANHVHLRDGSALFPQQVLRVLGATA